MRRGKGEESINIPDGQVISIDMQTMCTEEILIPVISDDGVALQIVLHKVTILYFIIIFIIISYHSQSNKYRYHRNKHLESKMLVDEEFQLDELISQYWKWIPHYPEVKPVDHPVKLEYAIS